MPRGGRHAGGAYTAPNGIQGQPRNSPDHYFGNCGGDDGGSPPLGPHLHWCATTFGSVIYALQGRKAMRHCGKPKCFVIRTAVTPRWGRIANRALRSTPFCGCSLITLQTVSLSDKFVRSVCAMSALNSSTITEMEVTASRFLYAAAILGTQLCDYYFFIKAVRRRLSAVNQGIVQETSPANVPPAAVGLGERLRHMIENNCG
ncbi:putative target of rapamycin (TOR) kinase 1 [Trypanosoma cruzi]|uniref:Putative target of rapamycin (TOR) kinase 1 n=1 Tax=Trypanosoma cruzi TaxID=5693 RepID=A0A2V2UQN1_TRYCR|nr:putative target of rapamycin (TOR) kinase 1 [Trypanosoma cruzi]